MHQIHDILKPYGLYADAVAGLDPRHGKRKLKLNIIALGDVGMTMLMGLRLTGGDVLERIGICDINGKNLERLEMEMNQIRYPEFHDEGTGSAPGPASGAPDRVAANPVPKSNALASDGVCASPVPYLPPVTIVSQEDLWYCDVLVFCASKGVPGIGAKGDVRMAQLEANRDLIHYYGEGAGRAGFSGLVAVVSDPVDPLAKAFLMSSGLDPRQFRGYGLGVMNARSMYYAERDARFASYLTEGRAFGPHGQDLVIANSIEHYDDALSRELTELTVRANTKVRDLGYKPYIAPALSSAAISILLTLRGQWHYSSLWFGTREEGGFLGLRNRLTLGGNEFEDLTVPDALYARIQQAYDNLKILEG